jgi:hypothetical protein
MTLSINDTRHNNISLECLYAECRYGECHVLFIVMQDVILLNVVMLSFITLIVILMSVIRPLKAMDLTDYDVTVLIKMFIAQA